MAYRFLTKGRAFSACVAFGAVCAVVLIAFIVSGGAAAAQSPSAARTGDRPPHIIIIMADDLGWNDVGYHGSEINTPHLDRLAVSGKQLTRFYVNSVCSPTRASLMTGQTSIRLGITAPMPKITPTGLPLSLKTLPQFLKAAHYQTALVGKWHLGVKPAYHPNRRGFDSFYGNLSGAVGYWDHVHGGHYDWQRDGKTVREEGYVTHLQAKEAVRVLKDHDKTQPLFMFVALGAPHLPNEAPAEAIAAYQHIEDPRRRVHAAMVSEMDTAIGQIIDTLEKQNMRDNTVVWFMSDNGGISDYRGMPKAFYRLVDTAKWLFGDDIPIRFLEFIRSNVEDGGSDNAPLRGAKGSVLEGGIRVPALVSMPGTLTPGRFSTRFSIVDILPTLLDLADAPSAISQPQDGRSYWPALTGRRAIPDAPFITQAFNGNSAVFHAQWKLLAKADGTQALYDVVADPSESRDLAAAHPDIVARLQSRLAAMPKGKNLAVPLWRVAIDPDEFGGVERKPPLAELYAE